MYLTLASLSYSTDRMNAHLDHIRIEGSTKHGGHQPDVFRVQISLKRTKIYCAIDNICIEYDNE